MVNVQRTADSIRYLAGILQDLPSLAQSLDTLGSLESTEKDLNARNAKLTEAKVLLEAELAEAKSGVLLIRDQGEKLVREAEDKSQTLLEVANIQVHNMLVEAKEKAVEEHRNQMEATLAEYNQARAQVMAENDKYNDLSHEVSDLSYTLNAMKEEQKSEQAKLDSNKAELAAIFARHQGE